MTVDVANRTGLEAHEPPEARGLTRDGVRLLLGQRTDGRPRVSHHRFEDLPCLLRPGDLLVVNTSGTLPAAVPLARGTGVVHFSTELADGRWLVEMRGGDGATRLTDGVPGARYRLAGGAEVVLLAPYSDGRLWESSVHTGNGKDVVAYLHRHGRPIRYSYVEREWELPFYQTVFATQPGSAEMPSAARPFTDAIVTRLVCAGVLIAPVLLHAGVASPEVYERPSPERFAVPAPTAQTVNHARADGGRVIAIGTTTVRALESAADPYGVVKPARGWTDLVITPERGVRVVDGLLTGLHEPRASHLGLVEAVAGADLVQLCYAEAAAHGYLWHEFGDVNLLLP